MDIPKTVSIIILSACGLLVVTDIIASVKIFLANKRFLKSDAVLRLYLPAGFTAAFILLLIMLCAASWVYIRDVYLSAALTAVFCSGIFYIFVFQFSVCGITSEALFVCGKIIEWHNVYDYYIDKRRKNVIFSNNAKGGLTLKGLTPPLKYRKRDEETLEKYLDGHKSKYFKRITIR